MMCSAASLAETRNAVAPPRGRVPLMGIVQMRRPRRARKSSGEAETMAQPVALERPRPWSGANRASAAATPAGSPSNGAERCCTRLTW